MNRARVKAMICAELRKLKQVHARLRGLNALLMRHEQNLTYTEIGKRLGGVSTERARQIVVLTERRVGRPHWSQRFTSARVCNCLTALGLDVQNMPEHEAARWLARYSRRRLMIEPNVGAATVEELREWLAEYGWQFASDEEFAPEDDLREQHLQEQSQ